MPSGSGGALVSVIVPVYNAEAFVAQALLTALAQTYSEIELVVVDDGSSDRSAEIVEAVAAKDARVRLIRTCNQGVAAARNLAIANARGRYIAPLDADDIWYPQKLEKQVYCLSRAEPAVGLVYTWSVHIDERGKLTGGCNASDVESDGYLPLVYSNFVGNASAPLIRREALERVGGYSTWYRRQSAEGVEDRELYLRLAERFLFRVIPEFLVGYRQLANSMSGDGRSMARAHRLLLAEVRRRHPEIPGRVYRWSQSRSCWYVGQKFSGCRNHARALVSFSKAAFLDPVILVNRRFYTLVFRNSVRLVSCYPVPKAVGQEWRQESATEGIAVADIQKRRQRGRRLWGRVVARRMQFLSHHARFPGLPGNTCLIRDVAGSGQQIGRSR
jgi:glycosyltransferase involved in cell wall biosynthesis